LIYSAYLGVAEGARNRALAMARKRPQDPLLAQTVGEMEKPPAGLLAWRTGG
jgi:acyl-CoA dehydrogenase